MTPTEAAERIVGQLFVTGDCSNDGWQRLGNAHDYRVREAVEVINAAIATATAELRSDLDAVNALAREFGYGQGELDDDLAGCLRKSCDQLRADLADADVLLGVGWKTAVATVKGQPESDPRDALGIQVTKLAGDVAELRAKLAAAEQREAELRDALPPAHRLRLLADLIDATNPDDPNPEVQRDLRQWADAIDAALSQQREAELREALQKALIYGLPPHDVSGQVEWMSARRVLERALNTEGGK